MTKKFYITDIPKEEETRIVSDRESDIKEIEIGKEKFSIIPMSEMLRAKCRRSKGKHNKAIVQFMEEELCWDKERAMTVINLDYNSASDDEKELYSTYNSDFSYASERVVFADWELAYEVMENCIIEASTEKFNSKTALAIVRAIESHSSLSESDRVVL